MSECEGQGCWAHIEWFCDHAGLARVFNSDQKYGDPYCYALPFVVREKYAAPLANGKRGLVEFVGVVKVMSSCQYRAMKQAMFEAGWGIVSTRIKDGKVQTVELHKKMWER